MPGVISRYRQSLACWALPGLADEALAYADTLFRLERQWKTCRAEQRHALRQPFSVPVLAAQNLVGSAPQCDRAQDLAGKAIRYALRFWPRLTRFLDDGRLPISNNQTEREIKPSCSDAKRFCLPTRRPGLRHWPTCIHWCKRPRPTTWNPGRISSRCLPSCRKATTLAQDRGATAVAGRAEGVLEGWRMATERTLRLRLSAYERG